MNGMLSVIQKMLGSPQAQHMMQDPNLQQIGMQAMQNPGMMQQALQGLMQMAGAPSGGTATEMPDSGVMAPGGEEFPPLGSVEGQMPMGSQTEAPAETSEEVDDVDSTEAELEAAQRAMGSDGSMTAWEGQRAPTQADVDALRADPEGLRESFDEQFGEGACEQYLEGDGSAEAEDDPY